MSQPIDIKVWGVQAPCTEIGADPASVAAAIRDAAGQEGVILHQCDIIGVSHRLASACGEFEALVQQALHQQAGVSPQVMLYDSAAETQPTLASLCSLVCQYSRNPSNVVVIQGAHV